MNFEGQPIKLNPDLFNKKELILFLTIYCQYYNPLIHNKKNTDEDFSRLVKYKNESGTFCQIIVDDIEKTSALKICLDKTTKENIALLCQKHKIENFGDDISMVINNFDNKFLKTIPADVFNQEHKNITKCKLNNCVWEIEFSISMNYFGYLMSGISKEELLPFFKLNSKESEGFKPLLKKCIFEPYFYKEQDKNIVEWHKINENIDGIEIIKCVFDAMKGSLLWISAFISVFYELKTRTPSDRKLEPVTYINSKIFDMCKRCCSNKKLSDDNEQNTNTCFDETNLKDKYYILGLMSSISEIINNKSLSKFNNFCGFKGECSEKCILNSEINKIGKLNLSSILVKFWQQVIDLKHSDGIKILDLDLRKCKDKPKKQTNLAVQYIVESIKEQFVTENQMDAINICYLMLVKIGNKYLSFEQFLLNRYKKHSPLPDFGDNKDGIQTKTAKIIEEQYKNSTIFPFDLVYVPDELFDGMFESNHSIQQRNKAIVYQQVTNVIAFIANGILKTLL